MSVYELRYEVHIGQVANYTDSAEEALRWVDGAVGVHGPLGDIALEDAKNLWVNEGYADYQDVAGGPGQIEGTIVTRRTIGSVPIPTLRYQVERARVRKMIEDLTGRRATTEGCSL